MKAFATRKGTNIPALAFVVFVIVIPSAICAEQGAYLARKTYMKKPLPRFSETRDKLPHPIFDEDPDAVRCYWKAWELAFRNFHEPAPGSGYVSQFIDAAFNQNIFLWDTCFLTMFCNYAHPHVPGICSLDNFYAKQHEDGEICREINRTTGKDFQPWQNREGEPLFSRWGYNWEKGARKVPVTYRGRTPPSPNPVLTLDALNHPILAWAEVESFRITGDAERLRMVWEPLVRYHGALKKYLRQGNGLYLTDSASMDNSPRNHWLEGGGTAIDTSSEMVLFARNLAEIASTIGKTAEAGRYRHEAEELSRIINEKMWDAGEKFYFDLTLQEEKVPVKTVASFWPLLGKVASRAQAAALFSELNNPGTFKTLHRIPTLAADQNGFNAETGRYWRGSVWAPTTLMVIRGLEAYGLQDLAREIARNHLRNAVQVFKNTGTIWENYAPQKIAPGKPAKPDFVGWSGIAPIVLFIEYAIGIRADAASNTIHWRIGSPKRVGIEGFWFAGKTVSLLCEEDPGTGKRRIKVKSDGPFRLIVQGAGRTEEASIPEGELELSL